MLEIEMKFPVAGFIPVRDRLLGWQARGEDVLEEADHYYNAPDRDFARTDEALRLRRIQSMNVLTYKGPKHAGPTKTRTEIEVSLEPGAAAAEKCCLLLTQLGFRAVAIVRKKRTVFHFDRAGFALQACLDDVDQLGKFVEVEIMASEEQKQQAQETLMQVAMELGLKDAEKRSYLEMHLMAAAANPEKK